MRYNRLGNSGLKVSELCLGTMTFGGQGMWTAIGNLDQNASEDLLKIAIDSGINFIDTANVYSEGMSEEITGQAIKNLGIPRDEVVIASKVFGGMGEGPNSRGSSRYHIMEQVKNSLSRLQMDHIDLYQLHGFDNTTPIEETLEALNTWCSTAMFAISAFPTGPHGRLPKPWVSLSARASPHFSRYRLITQLPGATLSAK